MWNPFARKDRAPQSRGLISDGLTDEAGAQARQERRSEIAEIEYIGATAVVTFTVTEVAGIEAVQRLLELLDRLMRDGATNFILDVQNVQLMDSACLGGLVKASRVIEESGGRIAMVNADRSVHYLFKLTKLDRMFPICVDVMSALAAIERPAARRAG